MSSLKSTLELSSHYHTASRAYSSYSGKLRSLSTTFWDLFAAQASDRLYLLSPICELLENLATVSSDSSSVYQRVSEDLRDIVERYAVLTRVTNERKAIARALETAKQKLLDFEDQTTLARSRKDFNQMKADQHLAKLRSARKEALVKARDSTIALIAERRKFANFAYRRISQAFGRFGKCLTVSTDTELRIVTKIIEALRGATEGVALADTNFQAIDLSEMVIGEAKPHVDVPEGIGGESNPPESIESEPKPQADVLESADVEKVVTKRIEVFDAEETQEKEVEREVPASGLFEEATSPQENFFNVDDEGSEEEEESPAPAGPPGKKKLRVRPSPVDDI